jgi:ketosteroid isomerase-like protein
VFDIGATNVELVREVYGAWARGDFSAGAFAPDFEWGQLPDAVEPGARRGPEVGVALRRLFEAYKDFRVEAEEFLDAGERVVVVACVRGTARKSGLELDQRFAFVWRAREAMLTGFQVYRERAEALKAVGLEE